MLTAVAGILGILVIGSWAVVAWGSKRRQPWLLAPLALLIVVLVATGQGGWAFLPIAALMALSFAELVIGSREAPSLRARDRDGPLSTERWAAAVAAPFRVAVAEPWDVISRPQLRRRYRKVLEEEWGITDRAGLLATVEGLWEELHSAPHPDLLVDLRTGVARTRSPEGAGSAGGAAPEQRVRLTPEQVERMREVTGAEEGVDSVVIGSYEWWKSAHLVRLACGGATLSWLSRAETQNLLRRVATDLQRRFSGWDRLSAAFHGGYLLWRGGAGGEGEPDRVWTALGILTADDDSPWRLLPWDMPLERVPYESAGTGEGSYVLPGAVAGGPSEGGGPAGGADGAVGGGSAAEDGPSGAAGGTEGTEDAEGLVGAVSGVDPVLAEHGVGDPELDDVDFDGVDGFEGSEVGAPGADLAGVGAGALGPVGGVAPDGPVPPVESVDGGLVDGGPADGGEEPPQPREAVDEEAAREDGEPGGGPFGGVEGGPAGARRR